MDARVHIVIADDDPDDLQLFEEGMADVAPDATIKMVYNGAECLQYLDACTDAELPSAILLDYSMPLMNGPEALAGMCKTERYDDIPKFIWSTSNSDIYIEECMGHGAMQYFVKPNTYTDLVQMLQQVLQAVAATRR